MAGFGGWYGRSGGGSGGESCVYTCEFTCYNGYRSFDTYMSSGPSPSYTAQCLSGQVGRDETWSCWLFGTLVSAISNNGASSCGFESPSPPPMVFQPPPPSPPPLPPSPGDNSVYRLRAVGWPACHGTWRVADVSFSENTDCSSAVHHTYIVGEDLSSRYGPCALPSLDPNTSRFSPSTHPALPTQLCSSSSAHPGV